MCTDAGRIKKRHRHSGNRLALVKGLKEDFEQAIKKIDL